MGVPLYVLVLHSVKMEWRPYPSDKTGHGEQKSLEAQREQRDQILCKMPTYLHLVSQARHDLVQSERLLVLDYCAFAGPKHHTSKPGELSRNACTVVSAHHLF